MDSAQGEVRAHGAARASLFISYARANREQVRPLATALTAAGYNVWWDAMIDGGASFARVIESRLDGADAVIVVWSASSVASDWVRDEAAHARDRKRLVAVTLDGAEPPLGFRQYHAIDFSGWNGQAAGAEFANLERSIAALEGGESAPLPLARAAAPDRPALSRRALLITGGAAVAVTAGGGALWWKRSGSGGNRNAVAVLPFANLSSDGGQDYFAQGLCEEVRAALVRNPALRVAAPTSSNEFRDHKDDARTIAGRLRVDFLLDGSVRKAGNLVRIDATLTDAATGFASWSQSFDRKLDDIFAVQREIADTVAGALLTRVSSTGKSPGGTEVVAAYDEFLRGRALFNADSGEVSDRAALARFEQAIALDPRFAAAHAARSRALAGIASLYASTAQIEPAYTRAVQAAQTAVSLAPNLAAAQLALGFATLNGFLDFKGARAAYDQAYAQGEGDADVLLMYAFFTAKSGRGDEALGVVRRAERLDPLNPRTLRGEAAILLGKRSYADAIAASNRALAMNPKLSSAHGYVGTAQLMLGQRDAASAAFAAEPLSSVRLAGQAIIAQRGADDAGAQQAWAQLLADYGDSAAYQQAQVLAQWGRSEAALAALDKAYAVCDGGMTGVLGDPLLDPLRGAAHFNQLLSQMGLA